MKWADWERDREYEIEERLAIICADTRSGDAPLSRQAVATGRDNYGWRSLPGGKHVTIAPATEEKKRC